MYEYECTNLSRFKVYIIECIFFYFIFIVMLLQKAVEIFLQIDRKGDQYYLHQKLLFCKQAH